MGYLNPSIPLSLSPTIPLAMAHLWIEQHPEWFVVPLERDELALADMPPRSDRRATLIKSGSAGKHDWHLVAANPDMILVNGMPVVGGIRTLLDRDEIRVAGLGALFFSTERLARIEPLPATLPGEVACPRCRQRMQPGVPAVRCPSCEVWHHASDNLNCWSYGDTCAMCRQPTALDTGYQWTPEDL